MAPSLNSLTLSTNRCSVDVRILSLWQSIKDEVSMGPVGLNMKLLDENGTSIEAYINPRIVGRFHPLLYQGEMYSFFDFSVVLYSDDIIHRVSKNPYYILFHEHTEVNALGSNDKAIPKYYFDLVLLKDVRHIKQDNNILIDIVGLIGCVELPSIVINDDGVEEKFVEFGITDGMEIFQVILWDAICEEFLEFMSGVNDELAVIVFQSCKLAVDCGVCTFTNHPATRFDITTETTIVQHLANKMFALGQSKSLKLCCPYNVAGLIDINIREIQCRVVCRMTVKNIDEHEEWFICICSECGLELEENVGSNNCPHCKVKIVMADKRYRLTAQAFDNSAELYILLDNNAVEKLVGKTVFEIELHQTSQARMPLLLKDIVNTELFLEIDLPSCLNHNGNPLFHVREVLSILKVGGNRNAAQKLILLSDSDS